MYVKNVTKKTDPTVCNFTYTYIIKTITEIKLKILKSTSLENINDAKQLIQYILENNFQEIYIQIFT